MECDALEVAYLYSQVWQALSCQESVLFEIQSVYTAGRIPHAASFLDLEPATRASPGVILVGPSGVAFSRVEGSEFQMPAAAEILSALG